jgi:hypothetical protein
MPRKVDFTTTYDILIASFKVITAAFQGPETGLYVVCKSWAKSSFKVGMIEIRVQHDRRREIENKFNFN